MTDERFIPDDVQADVEELRKSAQLVLDWSQGVPWAACYTAVAGMRARVDAVLAHGLSGPGLDTQGLSGRARLPVPDAAIDAQLGELTVPDHPGDDPRDPAPGQDPATPTVS